MSSILHSPPLTDWWKGDEITNYIPNEQHMRKSEFTEIQIVGILKQQEAGVEVADLCREAMTS